MMGVGGVKEGEILSRYWENKKRFEIILFYSPQPWFILFESSMAHPEILSTFSDLHFNRI